MKPRRLLAWGVLLRLSMAPSAAADAAAGLLLGAGTFPGGAAPWLLIAGSLCVYHGGMALNDWADRHRDAVTRPERPLPSRAIAPGAALGVALALLAAGPALALCAGPSAAACLGGVSVLALVYDLWGRGALLGPLLLGLCRAGNLGAGLSAGLAAAGAAASASAAWVLCAYGLYVFVLSRLGRLEDAEDARPPGRRPSLYLTLAGLGLIAAALVPLPRALPAPALALVVGGVPVALPALALALAGAFPLGLAALRVHDWTTRRILAAMGLGLRRLLIVTATLALRVGGPAGYAVAAAILAGYPLSHRLRRVFPPS